MRTDRDLLKLAAKAIGLKIGFLPLGGDKFSAMYQMPSGSMKVWNSLEDDGDALRLAVDLGMIVYTNACAVVILMDDESELAFEEDPGDDARAATRRAITRAAAEIGVSMSQPTETN